MPGYISYVAGNSGADLDAPRTTVSTFLLSLWFVLGFSSIFVALGASASGLSHLILAYRYEANIVGGLIVIVFGLLTTQLVRLPGLQRDFRIHTQVRGGRAIAAYTLGLAFGFGWTPCIGPVLGAILTVSAVSATASSGAALLGVYSLGLGLPFLLCALFMERCATALKSMRKAGRMLQYGAGGIMIVMGAAMATGRLSDFSFWLLDKFPVFSTIG